MNFVKKVFASFEILSVPEHSVYFMLHTWGGWPAIDQSCQKEMSNIFRGIIEKTVHPLFQPA